VENIVEANGKESESREENLTHMAYRRIKEMMLNYDIVPGQRLIFIDLAKKLGVSRTPVNNALSILANDGFLDFVPNQGYTVHQITRGEANALYELREIVEVGAVERAIEKATDEFVALLENQKVLYEKAVLENLSRGRFMLDQEFHAFYVLMSGNQYLAECFREVNHRIFLRHRIEGLPAGRAKQVVLEHDDIYHAIRSRDLKKAIEFIREHIRAGKEYIFLSAGLA
jgi:DNA-binding GntR family transcriptional regulator